MDMKINSVYRAYESFNVSKSSKATRTTRAEEKRDMVAVSSQGKDFASVMKALSQTPDVREDKVSSIKSQMAAGTYSVSAEDIANKMIKSFSLEIE